jgi:opacity protein-like surface antigen
MKQTLISASIVAMLSSGAIAGNIDTATADPVIAPPPASTSTDWSGSYCGLSYSSGGGTESSAQYGTYTYDYVDDTAIGGFCGNNWQRNNLVYGGELNVTAGSLAIDDSLPDELGARTELRARVGYAMGDALVYGFLGYGTSDLKFFTTGTGYDVAGGTYGLGVDYMVTDRMFAGVEVSNLELTGTPTGGGEYTHDITVISLRIGWKFN